MGGIVQGDEGPIRGVAQVFCHGVIVVVGHQEEGQEEEVEKQGEVEGKRNNSRNTAHGWHADGMKSANGLEPMWSVMSDQTTQRKTACRCAQFCMLRMSMCVASLL